MTTITTLPPIPTRRVRTGALLAAAALASVVLVPAGPAQARLELPQSSGEQIAQTGVSLTRLAGRYGVHVAGGWTLR